MQLNLKSLFTVLATTTFLLSAPFITNVRAADDTVKEKTYEAANDTKRAMKKTARKLKDKTCEMVNGKMECVGKKIKHATQNTGDRIEDAID